MMKWSLRIKRVITTIRAKPGPYQMWTQMVSFKSSMSQFLFYVMLWSFGPKYRKIVRVKSYVLLCCVMIYYAALSYDLDNLFSANSYGDILKQRRSFHNRTIDLFVGSTETKYMKLKTKTQKNIVIFGISSKKLYCYFGFFWKNYEKICLNTSFYKIINSISF